MPPFVAGESGKCVSEENGSLYVVIWAQNTIRQNAYTLHSTQISTGLTSNRSCKVRSTAAKRTERPWHASCWAERWVPQGDRRRPLSSPGSSLSGLSQHINRSFLHKVVGLWDKCSVGAQGGGRKSHLEVRKDGQRWHCVGCWSWSTQLSRIITFAKSNMGTVTLQRHDI